MDNKITIRPKLKGIADGNSTEMEHFQNLSLRPIIKLQHDLLIVFYKNYLISRKFDFKNTSNEKVTAFITNSLLKDNRLKNLLLGLIIGLFTVDEYKIYLNNFSEINKRIFGIVKQRLTDSLLELQ